MIYNHIFLSIFGICTIIFSAISLVYTQTYVPLFLGTRIKMVYFPNVICIIICTCMLRNSQTVKFNCLEFDF